MDSMVSIVGSNGGVGSTTVARSGAVWPSRGGMVGAGWRKMELVWGRVCGGDGGRRA